MKIAHANAEICPTISFLFARMLTFLRSGLDFDQDALISVPLPLIALLTAAAVMIAEGTEAAAPHLIRRILPDYFFFLSPPQFSDNTRSLSFSLSQDVTLTPGIEPPILG